MRKQRTISLLLVLCAIPTTLTGCGIRYAVHDRGYHRPPPPPPPRYGHHHHHGHPPSCRCSRCR
jgi:hypothetical protein